MTTTRNTATRTASKTTTAQKAKASMLDMVDPGSRMAVRKEDLMALVV
jgi:hypothetical protein